MIRSAYTLIELLVSIAIMMLLAGMAMPAYQIIQTRSRTADARMMVHQLNQAILLYHDGDPMSRYPDEEVDGSVRRSADSESGLLGLLEDIGLGSVGGRQVDASGRLLDPWKSPYLYRISARPTPSAGADLLKHWNWDTVNNCEKAWGRRVVNGVPSEGRLPFPYIWSLGTARNADDATTWIYPAEKAVTP